MKFGTTLKYSGAFLLVIIGLLLVWNFTPNRSAPFPPDPAVDYANRSFQPDNPYAEGYFEYNGITHHYVEAGEGPLVVLIHGFPAFWYAMIRQMEALKPYYRVVAVDALGAGLSDAPRELSAYTLKSTTEHLHALIEHLGKNGDDDIHLVGHDWGAAFAFAYAQNYPQKVDSVVGISAPPQNIFLTLLAENDTQRETSRYVEKLQKANPLLLLAFGASDKIWQGAYRPLLDANHIAPEESELFRQRFRDPKRINAYLNWYRANIPPFAEISEINYWPAKDAGLKMPVFLIRGKEDTIFVPEYIDLTQEISSSVEVLELDRVGHWPHMEAADQVNGAILRFLANRCLREANRLGDDGVRQAC